MMNKQNIKTAVYMGLLLGAAFVFIFLASLAHSQDVGSIDVVTTGVIAAGAADGPNKSAKKPPALPHDDSVGVELLGMHEVWVEGVMGSHTVERWHDTQSGVEFICVRDHGCVLTGRKWLKDSQK